MNKFRFTFQTFVLVVLALAFPLLVSAQATRTWVSGVGDDVNPCSRTAPCKTFAGAISKTAANGEINCLDPAGYGAVTITKSITIDCEDTQGSILASLVNGVILNAANIDVRLRGISINGAGNGINCVRVLNSGVKLTLDEVVCSGFTQHGVSMENSGGTNKLVVSNSSFRNLSGNGINTFLTGGATFAQITVDSSLFANLGIGVNLGVQSTASVNDSVISNGTTGLRADGATSVLSAKDNQITFNTTGILAANSATIRIGGNIITANGTGLSGSSIFSWGGNFVDGNTPGGNGSNNGAAAVQ
jgi:hypothetical protein